jgi:hypothetical protein
MFWQVHDVDFAMQFQCLQPICSLQFGYNSFGYQRVLGYQLGFRPIVDSFEQRIVKITKAQARFGPFG